MSPHDLSTPTDRPRSDLGASGLPGSDEPSPSLLDAGRPSWEVAASGSARRIVRDLRRRVAVVATYLLSYLGRRDARVWVFGNVRGFRDNPRYLAEHLVRHQPDIVAWWIARTEPEAQAAKSAGLQVAMRDDPRATRIQRRARVAFLSNGFQDLQAANLGGAYVVDLGHGKGLKRILLDMDVSSVTGRSLTRRALVAFHRWVVARRLSQIDLIVAPGTWAKARYVTAYRTPLSKIQVLGTPRFDVILGSSAAHVERDMRGRLGLSRADHLVLWLPTWRETGDASWLPTLDASVLESALSGTRTVILVKPHPYSDPEVFRDRLPDHARLRLLAEHEVDVNQLLGDADALITDYSSVAFDYALLDRPIHFFAPDAAAYRDGQGLYEPFEWLTDGRHHFDWSSLLAEVRSSAAAEDAAAIALARRIRERGGFNSEFGSCERIVAAVAAAVDIRLPPSPRSDEVRIA